MSARIPGAVLALGLCLAAAASAIRVGGEFPVPAGTEPLVRAGWFPRAPIG